MADLFEKHFGDKVLLQDLDPAMIKKTIPVLKSMNKNLKIPEYGILYRFWDNIVGVRISAIDSQGNAVDFEECTGHKTIKSWAEYHMKKRK